MGKLILLIIISIFISCNITHKDYNDVYYTSGEDILYESLNKNIEENVIWKSEKSELVAFMDQTSIKEYYIFLKQNNSKKLIKAPFNISCTNDDLQWERLLSCLINIKNFNRYMNVINVKTLDSTHTYFFNFISNEKDFIQLINCQEINMIIKDYPLKKRNSDINDQFLINDCSEINHFFSDSNTENIRICWFPDYGLIKFKFNYKDKVLMDVDSDFLGYLGNEDIAW